MFKFGFWLTEHNQKEASCNVTMRKSTRESKKPDVFTFKSNADVGSNASDDEDEDLDSSQSVEQEVKPVTTKNQIARANKNVPATTAYRSDLMDAVVSNRNIVSELTRWINSYKV